MRPASSIEARRLVIMKLLREGRIGPAARSVPSTSQPMRQAAGSRPNARSSTA